MKPVLLIDFGSTYTKAAAVDADSGALLGAAGAYTTVETDIGDGLSSALSALTRETGPLEFVRRFACSSAAGGLRMIACGLVPSLTVEAARRAALGAGAKVIRVFSYELTEGDAAEIGAQKPDILLLTGGTDGGNRVNIEQNARMLSAVPGDFPIVIAGNRAAADACAKTLSGSAHEVIATENVMPVFNKLNVEPVQAVIRALFLKRIVRAKGLSRQQGLIDNIMMPTPSAVLRALTLLSEGLPGTEGFGPLVAVDLGGATTDIYSIADGLPTGASTILRGLPEPHAKRTVEGDIGMRYSAGGVVAAAGMARIASLSGLTEDEITAQLARIQADPGVLPRDGDALSGLDYALAASAVAIGLIRHAGILEKLFTPAGVLYQQTGKDLTGASAIVMTGGALVHGALAEPVARYAMACGDEPASLKPRHARVLLDRRYILAAAGLMADAYPEAAFSLMRRELLCER